jgi:maltooligosyltrehalose trehalohydrolase
MHKFEVWAPTPGTVSVTVNGKIYSLEAAGHGYWKRSVADAGPGDDYGFILDGKEIAFPDPRSPWQPSGVNGPSRIVDHSAFRWSDSGWAAPPLSSAIFYELHVGTFTPEGTFDGVVAKLDYLLQLGVTHVEIMPVGEFPGSRGWGYDGVDLYAPHNAYGGPGGFKRLVNACHQKGLAVILDVVYNHLGPVGNYLGQFGPYFNDNFHTPWGAAVNLDGRGSAEVRRFFCDNAKMWLRDYHIDGLRLDAVHAFLDRSAVHFLEQLAIEVDALEAQLKRHLILIAESDLNQPVVVTPREANGYGIDAQWSDDFHHALHSVLTGESGGYYSDFGSLKALAKALESTFVYDGAYSEFRKRRHGRRVGNLSGARFLGYLQNHDQIGNRAQGQRSSHLMSMGRVKIGAALVMLAPYLPMLFQGEEFGASTPFQYFTDHDDPEIGEAVTNGRRNEFAAFGWNPEDIPNPQDEATFERSRLNWSEVDKEPHASLLAWNRDLISLRHSHTDLIDGRLDRVEVEIDEAKQQLRMSRGIFMIACNLAPTPASMKLSGHKEVVLASEPDVSIGGTGQLHLPPDSVVVIRSKNL